MFFGFSRVSAKPKHKNPKGNWQAVEDLSVGAPISVKARHSVHLLCNFERATEDELICQPLRPAALVIPPPWPYPAPFPYPPRPHKYAFEREKVEEVRLEHSEPSNTLIGAGVGAAAGAALGAATFRNARGPGALLFGAIGSLIGAPIGRTSPLFHRKVIYRR